jgi:hypothetical protein
VPLKRVSVDTRKISLGIKALNRARAIDTKVTAAKSPSTEGKGSLTKQRQKQNDNLKGRRASHVRQPEFD